MEVEGASRAARYPFGTDYVLQTAAARSLDGGYTWFVNKKRFPLNEELDVLPE